MEGVVVLFVVGCCWVARRANFQSYQDGAKRMKVVDWLLVLFLRFGSSVVSTH